MTLNDQLWHIFLPLDRLRKILFLVTLASDSAKATLTDHSEQ